MGIFSVRNHVLPVHSPLEIRAISEGAVLSVTLSHSPIHATSFGVGVLEFFAWRGYRSVTLLTDDVRLAAISLYFLLGFAPDMTRGDMPGRRQEVMRRLDSIG